jgi:hypothetical protein
MSRASGRKNPVRGTAVQPGTPEGDEIGESARQDPAGSPIPGLTGNITNAETVRRAVPAGEPFDEFRGMMAHGVPHDEHPTEERAQMERDGTLAQHKPLGPPKLHEPVAKPVPVPVYLGNITGPNSVTDPVRLCGRNQNRVRIGLLNEDTATNVRFAQRPSALVNGGGALLPWPNNSITWLQTQDELFAVTVSATLSVVVSVIEEFAVGGAG